ncbi:hypothetical protein EON65_47340 [archaeon]|nr:MAG: hypothetical protein EON65_47340 [archaeon]
MLKKRPNPLPVPPSHSRISIPNLLTSSSCWRRPLQQEERQRLLSITVPDTQQWTVLCPSHAADGYSGTH